MPELELGDGHLNSLGTTAKTIFDDSIPSQKEEENIIKIFLTNIISKVLKILWMKKVKFQKVYTFFMVEKVNSLYKH